MFKVGVAQADNELETTYELKGRLTEPTDKKARSSDRREIR